MRNLDLEPFDAIAPAGPPRYLPGEPPLTAEEMISPGYVDDLEGDLASDLRDYVAQLKQALTEPFAPAEVVRLARLLGALRAAWEIMSEGALRADAPEGLREETSDDQTT